ncbi:type I-F CRISPR-associated helicase Cas3f [Marinobacterium jannaschii]|uniref:type I-F CRISPR-associated helicase Cas3f n=1 Tax=Marinobacterium jannaschii TaxID=64970 RepID=UPI000489B8F5|nr:type I-F CRISPR-associated helicase Cas3f [Marinobacterium jannaschii]
MNILLIAQCQKNALKETRRILDQFAERRGDRSWQTPITQAGLNTLHALLRKTARKNTAVACHWIRGRNHSELIWIIGDASRFNSQGAVPTNSTRRNVLRQQDENDWHSGELIKRLAILAALLHDLGKACIAFQNKLKDFHHSPPNLYRHEWISLRLLQSFVGNDSDDQSWLQRLADTPGDEQQWLGRLEQEQPGQTSSAPLKNLPPLAQIVGWLIVSHHRLPKFPNNDPDARVSSGNLNRLLSEITAAWNQPHYTNDPPQDAKPYWQFDGPLPVASKLWQKQVSRTANALLKQHNSPHLTPDNGYLLHLSRLSLMLADHNYSSLSDKSHRDWVVGDSACTLGANTKPGQRGFKQTLDAHLLGVARLAGLVAHSLPKLDDHLPRLANHKGLRKRSKAPFQWQNKAFDLAESLRHASEQQGFFAINMASTGCGKTLANARIMCGLAAPEKGARFSIALGLRTLTLQTGEALRKRLHLNDDELAIRVGGSASRKLFEHQQEEKEREGSESAAELEDESCHICYEGDFQQHPLLSRLSHNPEIKKLLAAPLLSCTVDHLVPATEGIRGGRQIAPMLRLLTADLILDEIDDFDIGDLPALTRLVHFAAMLGSRVLLSSATLPPTLVEGLYNAYRDGRKIYQRNRGDKPGAEVNICCAWFDENASAHHDCATTETFATAHQQFVKQRTKKLATAIVRRRGELIPFEPGKIKSKLIRQQLAQLLQQQAIALHQGHAEQDPHSGKQVSFGLIRMANIEPLFDVALELFKLPVPDDIQIHLCAYHSQYPLLLRSRIEKMLDGLLQRHDEKAVFDHPEVRQRLDSYSAKDQIFIVLGSPVTEVGRDHDYDWAIVEPSSMRSIIQLAGRIRRHRPGPCELTNIQLLNTNMKALEFSGQPAYCKPGFENKDNRLISHQLDSLLTDQQWQTIDARPRIIEGDSLNPNSSLVDLEHHRLRKLMYQPAPQQNALSPEALAKLTPRQRDKLTPPEIPLCASSWYLQPLAQLSGDLPTIQPFRKQTGDEVELVLLPDEDEEDALLHEVHQPDGRRGDNCYLNAENKLQRIELAPNKGIAIWGCEDYMEALTELAESMEMGLDRCAKIYGRLSLPKPGVDGRGWRFHPALGFAKGQ